MLLLTIAIFTLTGGLFLGLMFTIDIQQRWRRILLTWLIAIIIGTLIGGALYADAYHQEKIWNNGICSCGERWTFTNASRGRRQTYYYYNCKECGNIIELTSKR